MVPPTERWVAQLILVQEPHLQVLPQARLPGLPQIFRYRLIEANKGWVLIICNLSMFLSFLIYFTIPLAFKASDKSLHSFPNTKVNKKPNFICENTFV